MFVEIFIFKIKSQTIVPTYKLKHLNDGSEPVVEAKEPERRRALQHSHRSQLHTHHMVKMSVLHMFEESISV